MHRRQRTSVGPAEVVLAGPNLEMALGDAEVDVRVANEGETVAGLHHGLAISCGGQELEAEALLIDGCGRKQSGLNAKAKPCGRRGIGVAHLLHALDFMLHALRLPVSDGDAACHLLARRKRERFSHLIICKSHPAGVEPERLRQQHNLLTIISDAFAKRGRLRPSHNQIIAHAGELAVLGETALESLRLVLHQLDVQLPHPVALINLRLQQLHYIASQRLRLISPHRMAGLYCFYHVHINNVYEPPQNAAAIFAANIGKCSQKRAPAYGNSAKSTKQCDKKDMMQPLDAQCIAKSMFLACEKAVFAVRNAAYWRVKTWLLEIDIHGAC